MARPHSHHCLLLLRLLLLLPAATAASYSSLCYSPAAAADVPKHSLGQTPLALPSISGYFSGGGDLYFSPDDRFYARAFSFHPRNSSARATTDPAVTHLSASLTLEGPRFTRRYDGRPHSVPFDLDGYYYYSTANATAELCMVGSGSYAREDGFGVVVLSDVVLRLSAPHPSNLTRPFVTGSLGGADFNPVALVAYTVHDYEYGKAAAAAAACPPPSPSGVARQVLRGRAGFSCPRLRALLGTSSYSLDYRPAAAAGEHAASGFPLRLRHRRMYVNQMDCDEHGNVRAYMVFYANQSDHSARWREDGGQAFSLGDEALVADGFWDAPRSQLCLKACRVARSGQSSSADDLAVRECGIGVSFWFPAVWSVRDRSVAAGTIWNASGGSDDGDAAAGVISVSRTGRYGGNTSGIKYNYTLVEAATKHYLSIPALSRERKGRFPGSSYSFQDFAFRFFMKKQGWPGYASPVTIGSAMVQGARLTADAAFAAEEVRTQRLLNVSYSLWFHVNSSASSPQLRRVSAEGVYDTETGSLCMMACREINVSSDTDCEVLVTVQFAPMGAVARERAAGTISSLRNESDPLFFEALRLVGDGMDVEQREESSSRVDMEGIMLVASMALSCVFTALQLRHVKKHPEALPATSVTMLAVLALGYAIPLVLNLGDNTYSHSREKFFVRLASGGLLELNELMLRVTTMLAFVLQLRLLQLALSRRPADEGGSKHEGSSSPSSSSSSSDAERSTLWICLPLYALGAVVVWIVHLRDALPGLALADDLAGYAGLVLDGFLLPQVVRNAISGSEPGAALSPWFYAGGTVIRAAPHAYDAFRKRNYVPSSRPSYLYASPRDDLFGAAWDVAVPCGAALLAALLFLQQRLGGAFLCGLKGRRSGGYEMVSTLSS